MRALSPGQAGGSVGAAAGAGDLLGRAWATTRVGGPIALVRDGDIIELDAIKGTLNVRLSDGELAERKKDWRARESASTTGYLWKYAQQVGPAVNGAVTHPGAAREKACYADI